MLSAGSRVVRQFFLELSASDYRDLPPLKHPLWEGPLGVCLIEIVSALREKSIHSRRKLFEVNAEDCLLSYTRRFCGTKGNPQIHVGLKAGFAAPTRRGGRQPCA
jgi:hypothetical protein